MTLQEEGKETIGYLCTYDLYGHIRNVFDASIHHEGKWDGVGPWTSRFLGPESIQP